VSDGAIVGAPDRSNAGADAPGIARWFPPARVRVCAGNVELRLPTDAEIAELVAGVDAHGVHGSDVQPMMTDWPLDEPAVRAQRMFAWHWHTRSAFAPESWRWLPAVFVDGVPVGAQDLVGERFASFRTAETASWLLRSHQGRGLGKQMRAMVLHLLFEHLGGRFATTLARADNGPSNGVTRALGYEPNGETEVEIRGEPRRTLAWRMSADRWRQVRPDLALDLDVVVHGLDDEARAAFGAS
jgi:RimJ/RimL family protein N-acetyltransferase